MDEFDALLERLTDYIDTRVEYQTAADKVNYDRAYHCSYEAERLSKAKNALKVAFDAYLDSRK